MSIYCILEAFENGVEKTSSKYDVDLRKHFSSTLPLILIAPTWKTVLSPLSARITKRPAA